MRIWPYQMLLILPTRQLVSQWRECLAISGMIYGDGNKSLDNINHATINRIKNYPLEHFAAYCDLVRLAFAKREFIIGTNTIEKLNNNIDYENLNYNLDYKISNNIIYSAIVKTGNNNEFLWENFHNDRYLKQCLYMFQEKHDVDMLYNNEWGNLINNFHNFGKFKDIEV